MPYSRCIRSLSDSAPSGSCPGSMASSTQMNARRRRTQGACTLEHSRRTSTVCMNYSSGDALSTHYVSGSLADLLLSWPSADEDENWLSPVMTVLSLLSGLRHSDLLGITDCPVG
ncbi:hypothetical protein DAEQUDRAFT_6160 [Daedalea quercina L-15889]|uniref:Uncharacterized protein n=1 Tax=Daedalea quercina L-15889 TaxID=1314783 RepID=A0A165UE28_9APHY|nr:hypothetical protein DAEQUDRAFT_6160 [Daedalea quercina L-15889]